MGFKRKEKFSIRKYKKIGAASVLLGTFFLASSTGAVLADEATSQAAAQPASLVSTVSEASTATTPVSPTVATNTNSTAVDNAQVNTVVPASSTSQSAETNAASVVSTSSAQSEQATSQVSPETKTEEVKSAESSNTQVTSNQAEIVVPSKSEQVQPSSAKASEASSSTVTPAVKQEVEAKLQEEASLSATALTASKSEQVLNTQKFTEVQSVYRLYNPNSGEHHYTTNAAENTMLANIGWKAEGIGWYAPKTGKAVYRLYNPNTGDHHYTANKNESDYLDRIGWNYEGIGWYSGGNSAIYRLYNPNAKKAGSHHYTLSKGESDYLDKVGWNYEGIGWYAVSLEDLPETSEKNSVQASLVDSGILLQLKSSTVKDLSKVKYRVWSTENGQDDLQWYTTNAKGQAIVAYKNLKGTGQYNIYAYQDNNGTIQALAHTTITLPSAKDIKTSINKVDEQTYQVTVSNVPIYISGITVPVWTNKNGQDDLKWYTGSKQSNGSFVANIKVGNHNLETGHYNVHVYGTGLAERIGLTVTDGFTVTATPEQTGVAVVSNVDKSNYSFTTTITEAASKAGIKAVKVAVWSDSNGQDDMEWYDAYKQKDGSYKAITHLATHKYVNGKYNVHVYYQLNNGKMSPVALLTTQVSTPAPRAFIQQELAAIRTQFNSLIGSLPGDKSLIVTPTDGTELLVVNDKTQRSASTIKLFIMASAFAKAERGELNLSSAYTVKSSDIVAASVALTGKAGQAYTLDDITRMMVQYSDNTATNIMINAVGGVAAVNNEIRRMGYTKTTLNRYMRIQSQIDAGLENYISASEAVDLLKNIYNSASTASDSSDRSMLNKLSNNYYKLWLPTVIQGMAQTWDKPGNDAKFGVENDIAIIKRNGRAYAVGVLTQHTGSNGLSNTNRFAQFGLAIAQQL